MSTEENVSGNVTIRCPLPWYDELVKKNCRKLARVLLNNFDWHQVVVGGGDDEEVELEQEKSGKTFGGRVEKFCIE